MFSQYIIAQAKFRRVIRCQWGLGSSRSCTRTKGFGVQMIPARNFCQQEYISQAITVQLFDTAIPFLLYYIEHIIHSNRSSNVREVSLQGPAGSCADTSSTFTGLFNRVPCCIGRQVVTHTTLRIND